MKQFKFTQELLKTSKQSGIHTCMETSGYATLESFEEIQPIVDLFLFDYKATGEELHKELTGVGSSLILSNLVQLAKKGASIILRCPLIPGINDQRE